MVLYFVEKHKKKYKHHARPGHLVKARHAVRSHFNHGQRVASHSDTPTSNTARDEVTTQVSSERTDPRKNELPLTSHKRPSQDVPSPRPTKKQKRLDGSSTQSAPIDFSSDSEQEDPNGTKGTDPSPSQDPVMQAHQSHASFHDVSAASAFEWGGESEDDDMDFYLPFTPNDNDDAPVLNAEPQVESPPRGERDDEHTNPTHAVTPNDNAPIRNVVTQVEILDAAGAHHVSTPSAFEWEGESEDDDMDFHLPFTPNDNDDAPVLNAEPQVESPPRGERDDEHTNPTHAVTPNDNATSHNVVPQVEIFDTTASHNASASSTFEWGGESDDEHTNLHLPVPHNDSEISDAPVAHNASAPSAFEWGGESEDDDLDLLLPITPNDNAVAHDPSMQAHTLDNAIQGPNGHDYNGPGVDPATQVQAMDTAAPHNISAPSTFEWGGESEDEDMNILFPIIPNDNAPVHNVVPQVEILDTTASRNSAPSTSGWGGERDDEHMNVNLPVTSNDDVEILDTAASHNVSVPSAFEWGGENEDEDMDLNFSVPLNDDVTEILDATGAHHVNVTSAFEWRGEIADEDMDLQLSKPTKQADLSSLPSQRQDLEPIISSPISAPANVFATQLQTASPFQLPHPPHDDHPSGLGMDAPTCLVSSLDDFVSHTAAESSESNTTGDISMTMNVSPSGAAGYTSVYHGHLRYQIADISPASETRDHDGFNSIRTQVSNDQSSHRLQYEHTSRAHSPSLSHNSAMIHATNASSTVNGGVNKVILTAPNSTASNLSADHKQFSHAGFAVSGVSPSLDRLHDERVNEVEVQVQLASHTPPIGSPSGDFDLEVLSSQVQSTNIQPTANAVDVDWWEGDTDKIIGLPIRSIRGSFSAGTQITEPPTALEGSMPTNTHIQPTTNVVDLGSRGGSDHDEMPELPTTPIRSFSTATRIQEPPDAIDGTTPTSTNIQPITNARDVDRRRGSDHDEMLELPISPIGVRFSAGTQVQGKLSFGVTPLFSLIVMLQNHLPSLKD
ncbi:hypothetical protein ONZ45_g12049 [Pleurotus djamor]|nr:hypothetical protein ONZ45_g12049 [Pleurotus djamor]